VLIVLDTTLVWLLVRNSNHPLVRQARAWAAKRKSEGHEFAVAEINDYETRRELLRKNAQAQVQRLDALLAQLESSYGLNCASSISRLPAMTLWTGM
jgi:hypothetical protein